MSPVWKRGQFVVTRHMLDLGLGASSFGDVEDADQCRVLAFVDDLARVLVDEFSELDGITRTTTDAVLRTFKTSYDWSRELLGTQGIDPSFAGARPVFADTATSGGRCLSRSANRGRRSSMPTVEMSHFEATTSVEFCDLRATSATARSWSTSPSLASTRTSATSARSAACRARSSE